MSLTIAEIATRLGLKYSGNGSREISRVSGWAEADGVCLVFWDRADGAPELQEVFPAGCVVARPGAVPSDWPAILSERPKLDFARAAAILNPPRTGLSQRVMRGLMGVKPRMMTYLSCNPMTFKRDAHAIIQMGYKLEQVYAFDLFPGTFHLEILGVFSR